MRDTAHLPLWNVLRAHDTAGIAAQLPGALRLAAERCETCHGATKCAHLLAAGREADIEAFCPNIMYFKHLEAMKRHAPKKELLG